MSAEYSSQYDVSQEQTQSTVTEIVKADETLLQEAKQLLLNPYLAFGNGTKDLGRALQVRLTAHQSTLTPHDVISQLAQEDEMLALADSLWDQMELRNKGTAPFTLAVLHSQLPLEAMPKKLYERVSDLLRVPYSIDTFSNQIFCSKSEGYLAAAVKADMAGFDDNCFLVKSSRRGSEFGFTGGVTSRPVIATGGESEVIIVPNVWYKPPRLEDKESISQQMTDHHGSFSLPHSQWQIVRQFDELDFSQVAGKSLHEVQKGMQPREAKVVLYTS